MQHIKQQLCTAQQCCLTCLVTPTCYEAPSSQGRHQSAHTAKQPRATSKEFHPCDATPPRPPATSRRAPPLRWCCVRALNSPPQVHHCPPAKRRHKFPRQTPRTEALLLLLLLHLILQCTQTTKPPLLRQELGEDPTTTGPRRHPSHSTEHIKR